MPFARRPSWNDPELYASIRQILRRRGVAADDIDDRCQHVLLEAHSAEDAPRTEPARRRYIHGIARNVARRYWTERRTGPEIAPLDEDAENHAKVLPQYEMVDFVRRVLDQARTDDPRGSDWVVRAKVRGETDQEIAEAEGVRPAGVRQRVRRTLAKMREHAGALAAATALLILVIVLARGYEWLFPAHRTIAAPPHPVLTGSLQDRAARLRRDGVAACHEEQWAQCENDLDEARAIDPDGEVDDAVKSARTAIAAAKSHR